MSEVELLDTEGFALSVLDHPPRGPGDHANDALHQADLAMYTVKRRRLLR